MDNILDDFKFMVPHFMQIVDRKVTGSWTNQRSVWQTHSFILLYDGEAVIGCNEERHVKRGDLIYFKPGDIRWGYTFEDNPMRCFGIDFKYICVNPSKSGDEWEFRETPLPLKSFTTIGDSYYLQRMLDLFQRLARDWISPDSFTKVYRERAYFMEILHYMILWSSFKQNINYDKFRKVEKVSEYILNHYAEPIKLKDLSSYIGLSPSYLQVIFKEITGTSPIDYLINVRINKAKELFKDGISNIAEVADAVGFNDPFYFSRTFKKLEGISPSEYYKRLGDVKRFI